LRGTGAGPRPGAGVVEPWKSKQDAPHEIRRIPSSRRERKSALLLSPGTPYADGNDELGCPVCLFQRVLEPGSEEDPGLPYVVRHRPVMAYQTWFGEGPELSVLRMLGLFDRAADEKAIGALLKPPVISGLTESLNYLSPTEWRTILARLRRARLLAAEDPQNPGQLDTHPLVRDYPGEQLRSQQTEAWKECNRPAV
jgi:hypothetical protein